MKRCPKCKKWVSGDARLSEHIADKHPGFSTSDEPRMVAPSPSSPPSSPKTESPEPTGTPGEKLDVTPSPPKTEGGETEKLTFAQRVVAKVRQTSATVTPIEPIDDWELPEAKVADFVQGVMNLIREAVQFIDRVLAVDPIDGGMFQLNPAERMNAGMILQRPVTKALKSMGYKSVEEASMFIDAFSLFSVFAHLGMGLVMHGITVFGIVRERQRNGLTITGKPKTETSKAKANYGNIFGFKRRRTRGAVEDDTEETSGGGSVETSPGGVGATPAAG